MDEPDADRRKDMADKPAEPPGQGESLEDAARDALAELEGSETPHAGKGDGG